MPFGNISEHTVSSKCFLVLSGCIHYVTVTFSAGLSAYHGANLGHITQCGRVPALCPNTALCFPNPLLKHMEKKAHGGWSERDDRTFHPSIITSRPETPLFHNGGGGGCTTTEVYSHTKQIWEYFEWLINWLIKAMQEKTAIMKTVIVRRRRRMVGKRTAVSSLLLGWGTGLQSER